MLGPLVKLGNTEFSTERTRAHLDGMGPAATTLADEDVVESFLYAPGMRVAGGTSEIQRNLIGERLLVDRRAGEYSKVTDRVVERVSDGFVE